MTTSSTIARFRELHTSGHFVIPNPWDVGSARILEALGFPALATTSAGFAATLGRTDQTISRDELLDHARSLAEAVDIPVSVDAEDGLADDPQGVADTVTALAATGVAGCSIEDAASGVEFDEQGLTFLRRGTDTHPESLYPMAQAVERIAAAVEAARPSGLVLTARAENYLHDRPDLDDTIQRLVAFREAGADVLYAPGLTDIDDITRVVQAVGAPVNVLALPGGPTVAELAAVGVRRISLGGALAGAAYSTLVRAARELIESETTETLRAAASQPNPFSLFAD